MESRDCPPHGGSGLRQSENCSLERSSITDFLDPGEILEHAAQLKEPFAVAGVADAAADKEWADGCFGQEACGNVVGEVAAGGYGVHFPDFVGSDGVNLLAQKWRKDQQITQEPPTK